MKKRKLLVALAVTICLLLTLTVVLVMAADGGTVTYAGYMGGC